MASVCLARYTSRRLSLGVAEQEREHRLSALPVEAVDLVVDLLKYPCRLCLTPQGVGEGMDRKGVVDPGETVREGERGGLDRCSLCAGR